MKKFLLVLVVLVAAVAVALPASAANLKFGGLFEQVFYSTDNLRDGDDDTDDNINVWKTRLRLYFSAIGSDYLKVHSKFEVDNVWGSGALGSISADGTSKIEVKNMYLDFSIPDTPLIFYVGTFGAKLAQGIVFFDDTTGVMVFAEYEPLLIQAMYSRLGDSGLVSGSSAVTGNDAADDVDFWGGAVNYTQEEFKAAFSIGWVNSRSSAGLYSIVPGVADPSEDFDLIVLAVDGDYSTDMFSAYLTAAFNTGEDEGKSQDFAGYYVTAGGSYFMDIFTFGADFFYASGDDDATDGDFDGFLTVGGNTRPSRFMDEAIFPGWLTDVSPLASNIWAAPAGATTTNVATGTIGTNSVFFITNILAIGAHVDVKPLDKTLLNAGFAWMKFAEDVTSAPGDTDDSLGTSIYARISQGIVDGLVFKVTGGYFFADDGYTSLANDDDAYRLAAALQWGW